MTVFEGYRRRILVHCPVVGEDIEMPPTAVKPGRRTPRQPLTGVCVLAFSLVLLAGCTPQPPPYPPPVDRLLSLRVAIPPVAPEPRTEDTGDEAEIQFRAALVFYRKKNWEYAIPAFAEAVDYDDDRQDARFYWAASLVLAGRNAEAVPLLEELLETPFEMQVRPLLARVLYRTGHPAEARAMAAPAIHDSFDAAGWVAMYDLLTP